MKIAPEHRGRGVFTERLSAFVTEEQAHAVWRIAAEEEVTQASVVRAALAEFLERYDDDAIHVAAG